MENRFCRKLNKADEYDSMVVLTMMIIMPCAVSYLMLFKVHLLTKPLVWGSYDYAYMYIYIYISEAHWYFKYILYACNKNRTLTPSILSLLVLVKKITTFIISTYSTATARYC